MSLSIEKSSPFDILGTAAAFEAITTTAEMTSIIDIGQHAKKLTLEIYYNAAAATGGAPRIVPMLSANVAKPAQTEDAWVIPGVWDGSVTAASGMTPSSGLDWTATPTFAKVTHRPLELAFDAATVSGDKLRIAVTINVEAHRWAQFQIADLGATGGSVWIRGIFHA